MVQKMVGGFRLSPQQERLWTLAQGDAGSAYRSQCAVLIEGQLDIELLKEALKQVTARNQILRTSFHLLPEMTIPLQVISEATPAGSVALDSIGRIACWQEAQIKALFEEIRKRPLDTQQIGRMQLSIASLNAREHLLIISLPAMHTDAAGLKNLVREIGQVYADLAHRPGEANEPVQYNVVSEWLNDLLESEDAEAGRQFWRTMDLSSLQDLKIGCEKQPGQHAAFDPQLTSSVLPAALTASIDSLVEDQGVSEFDFALACWSILLHKISGKADMVIGASFDGRTDNELEEMLGLLAKYLPVHCHIDDDSRFTAVLSDIAEATRNAYEWQECFSWSQIRESGQGRTEADFFPYCYSFERLPAKLFANGLTLSIIEQYSCIERFCLNLSCVRNEESLSIHLHYDAARFGAQDAERLIEQLQALIESAAINPQARTGELSIVSNAELRRVIFDWNATESDFSTDRCIHELFQEQAARTPDEIAVVFEEERLTYSELNRRSNQLASYLRRFGVGPERLVAIKMDRCIEMVVGMLGTLKAGGAYVPLDPSYPKERLALIMQEVNAAVLLTQQALLEEPCDHDLRVISLDGGWSEIAAESAADAPSGATADNLAYVIYTSGSTGRPKGVAVSHRALCNHMLWMRQAFPVTGEDRILQKTAFSFDASATEFYLPLMTGARLVIARPGGHRDLGYLVESIAEHGITVLQVVPSVLRVLLDQPGFRSCESLSRVFCGGEVLSADTRDRFFDCLKAELHNLYGPTEAAIDVTCWTCLPEPDRRSVSVGRPISNVQIYLLDSDLNPVPVGMPGELYIGGTGLARGYFTSPDLTAERFIPDRFGERGSRLYRSGDLARYRSDGAIEYLGRTDNQVKIRGLRLEPGEIEAALNKHPGIQQSVVIVHEDENRNAGLAAYVVPDRSLMLTSDDSLYLLPQSTQDAQLQAEMSQPLLHGEALSADQLQAFLKETLPDYMVPSAFIMLGSLPSLPNGKIDRRALPAPDSVQPRAQRAYVAPSNPIEEKLAEIWARVLGRERVSVNDNFFELGGHSLLATVAVSHIREAFQIEVPLRYVFEAPTVSGLSAIVLRSLVEQTNEYEVAQMLDEIEQL